MGLTEYRRKRSFKKTPEPVGGKPGDKSLHFVIQKHAATNLHYDFRLEMHGVLKSWAVPKGPSTDPAVKRLAMMVEDHPYDYRHFEGIIPKGQYGGGTVIVWDEGSYEPVETNGSSKKQIEKNLIAQLHQGKLKFRLHGKKLKGDYALVKASSRGDNSWLLMKVKDKYATSTDITRKTKSVVSGKTIEQVEKTSKNTWQSKPKKTKTTKTAMRVKKKSLPSGKKAAYPRDLIPMLATLVDKPFDEEAWFYEVKWDGYRALAYMNNGRVELRSRNNKDFNKKYFPIHDALTRMNIRAVLDGEIIVATESGGSHFGNLQNWRSEADGELRYYVFDILWLDGYSLLELPLSVRREKLETIITEKPPIFISKAFETSGTEFFEVAKKMKLEGIMAKKAESDYKPGIRSREWLKIKTGNRQEMVIGGFTKNEGSSKPFSSLLVGVFDKGKLIYMGKAGTGFSQKLQKEMIKMFEPLITKKNPFYVMPDVNKPSRFRPDPPHAEVTWLKPKIVCEVAFTEMTSDGVMRHPSFEGLRVDKSAKEVVKEKPKRTRGIVKN